MSVVPGLEVLEELWPSVGGRLEAPAIDQLTFQRREGARRSTVSSAPAASRWKRSTGRSWVVPWIRSSATVRHHVRSGALSPSRPAKRRPAVACLFTYLTRLSHLARRRRPVVLAQAEEVEAYRAWRSPKAPFKARPSLESPGVPCCLAATVARAAGLGRHAGVAKSADVEAVQVHDLVPGGDEVVHELFLRVVLRVDLGQGAQLGV